MQMFQRQQIAVVLEQHDGFARGTERYVAMRRTADHGAAGLHVGQARVLEEPHCELGAQNATAGYVKANREAG